VRTAVAFSPVPLTGAAFQEDYSKFSKCQPIA
jgi:hypothetical protein